MLINSLEQNCLLSCNNCFDNVSMDFSQDLHFGEINFSDNYCHSAETSRVAFNVLGFVLQQKGNRHLKERLLYYFNEISNYSLLYKD